MQPVNIQIYPSSSYFLHLRNIYMPQPVFLQFCDRPSFTPTQNKGQNYRSDKSCCKPMAKTDDDFSGHELTRQGRTLT
jgi:hypothetical protein